MEGSSAKRPRIDESQEENTTHQDFHPECNDDDDDDDPEGIHSTEEDANKQQQQQKSSAARQTIAETQDASDTDDFPFYTQPTERPFIDDSQSHNIHLIREEQVDSFFLKSENKTQEETQENPDDDEEEEEEEGNVTLDRVWLSPPHQPKPPRIGASYQVNDLPLIHDSDHS